MKILKIKFELENTKKKTVSISNIKATVSEEDIKVLGNYIATNKMLSYDNIKLSRFLEAVIVDNKETVITA